MDAHLTIIVDTAGVIRFWSAQDRSAFGYSPTQAVGQSIEIIIPPHHRDAHRLGFQRAMASGKAAAEGQSGAFPLLRADGASEEVPGRLTLLRESQGRVIGAMVVFG